MELKVLAKETIEVVSSGLRGAKKPETVSPYLDTLPDCIIARRGPKVKDDKWYYEVECQTCGSLLLTREVVTNLNITGAGFWCPVCEKESTYYSKCLRSFNPQMLRHPGATACTIL